MTTYIYTLTDPITNQIRYVGKTINLKERYKNHLRSNPGTHCSNWIKSLRNKNLVPLIEVIDETDSEDWASLEQYWIAQIRAWGFNLVNLTDGGEGASGFIASKATRDLHSLIRRGRFTNKLSEEQVLEIRDLLVGGYGTKQIGEKFNVSKSTIQYIKEGRTWKHLGILQKTKKSSSVSPDKIIKLYQMFSNKASVKQIGSELRICIATIAKQRKLWKQKKESLNLV